MFFALLSLLACEDLNPGGGQSCTELAAASVMLTVVGPDGEPMDADVSATDADGNEVQGHCSDLGEAPCSEWVVGYEQRGKITIVAEAFDGCNYGTGTVVVNIAMDDDECHVVGQQVELAVEQWTERICTE